MCVPRSQQCWVSRFFYEEWSKTIHTVLRVQVNIFFIVVTLFRKFTRFQEGIFLSLHASTRLWVLLGYSYSSRSPYSMVSVFKFNDWLTIMYDLMLLYSYRKYIHLTKRVLSVGFLETLRKMIVYIRFTYYMKRCTT